MGRVLRLQLKRGLSYKHGDLRFVRGTPQVIEDPHTYHQLLRTGYLADPEQQFTYINPLMLKRVKAGQEVVVVRDMGMGDVLMVSIAVREFAQRWKQLRVSYAVDERYLPLFQHCDFLHRTFAITDMVGRYDHVLDLRGLSERAAARYSKDRIDIFAEALGVKVEDYSFPYQVTEKEEAVAHARLEGAGMPTIGLVVRSTSHLRTWPFFHVVEFCRLATEESWGIVLLDHDRIDLDMAGVLNLTGTMSMRELAAVVSECDAIVAPDTGTMHLAEAVRTDCVAIFAAIDPAVRITHYEHVTAMWRGWERKSDGQKVLQCCPCWERGCPDTPCLTGITPAMVMDKVREVLRGRLVGAMKEA